MLKDWPDSQNADTGFLWLTNDGRQIDIARMGSHHLFYVLRRIWNSGCPRYMLMGVSERPLFTNPFYTNEYVTRAAKLIAAELTTRSDLAVEQVSQLLKMRQHMTLFTLERR